MQAWIQKGITDMSLFEFTINECQNGRQTPRRFYGDSVYCLNIKLMEVVRM